MPETAVMFVGDWSVACPSRVDDAMSELLRAKGNVTLRYEDASEEALQGLLLKIENELSGDRGSVGALIDRLDQTDRDLLFSSFSDLLAVIARRFEEAAISNTAPSVRDLMRGVENVTSERPRMWSQTGHFSKDYRDLVFRLSYEKDGFRPGGLAPRLAELERAYRDGFPSLLNFVAKLGFRRLLGR